MAGQSPILNLVDFIDDMISGGPNARANLLIFASYVFFFAGVNYLWQYCSDQDFSFVLTVSQLLQALGFFLLLHKIRVQRSVAGISSKTLQIYAMVFMFRLSSTMVKNGYLPVDATGDWVYQGADICSLFLVVQTLYFIHKRYKHTFQAELDTMPIHNILPGVMLFACMFHGELNHSPFFDKAWSVAMWFDSFAMLPQLWMLVAKGGEVEALTANFVALIFVQKCFAFSFWYHGYPELAPRNGGFNKVGALILTAHAMQILFSADFMFHYFRWRQESCAAGGFGCHGKGKLILPTATDAKPAMPADDLRRMTISTGSSPDVELVL